jgi:hypothetical protein
MNVYFSAAARAPALFMLALSNNLKRTTHNPSRTTFTLIDDISPRWEGCRELFLWDLFIQLDR